MKKFFIACMVLLLVFILCFGGIFLLFRKEVTEQFKKIVSGVNGNSSAILLIDSGTVMVKSSEEGNYEKAYDQKELYEGVYIKTDTESESHIILTNNSVVSLDENTEIKLTDLPTEKENSTFIEQFVGNAWHRVGELTGTGNYQVETPNAIAAVRGTIFGTGINGEGEDEIFSIENTVSVGQKIVENGNRKVENEQTVSNDNYVHIKSISDTSGFSVESLPETVKSSDWFTRNRELDSVFKDIDYKNFSKRDDLIKKFREKQEEDNSIFGNLDGYDVDSFATVQEESGDSCSDINDTDIDETIALFEQIQGYYNFGFSASELKSFYTDLKEVCSDGYITRAEALYLSSRHSFLNKQ